MELIVPDDQLSLAIGRGGQNVRLAAQLTGWNLDIISESRLAEIMQEAKRSLLNHGIEDESLIDTLFTLGYNKLEHIARVDPLELAQIPGFGMDNAEHIVSVAMEILAESKKVRTNKEEEARNIKAIATYLGLTNNQARQVYAAGYKDLSILFLESDPHRLDAKTGIGQNRAPELIEDLYTIATEDGVYTEEELAEAREIFDRSLRELPNCTLAQAYNCTVESVGERKFPRENEELDDVEDVNDEIENIDEDGQE